MDVKDQIRILVQALNHLRSQTQTLREALAQHGEEACLLQWGRRTDRDRRWQWIQNARN
jgi:hypothetical protein